MQSPIKTCTQWILILPEWRPCVKISQEHVGQSHPKQCNAWSQLTFSVTYLNCLNISMLVKFEVNCVCKNLYCFASVSELEYTNIILNKQFCLLLRILWKSFTNSCLHMQAVFFLVLSQAHLKYDLCIPSLYCTSSNS